MRQQDSVCVRNITTIFQADGRFSQNLACVLFQKDQTTSYF
jgi:hypothetical protein